MKSKHHEELRINPNNSSTFLQINPLFFASPWQVCLINSIKWSFKTEIPKQGVGGRLVVWPWSKVGRIPSELPSIQHGAEIVDYAWNPFDDHMVATGGEGVLFNFKDDNEMIYNFLFFFC